MRTPYRVRSFQWTSSPATAPTLAARAVSGPAPLPLPHRRPRRRRHPRLSTPPHPHLADAGWPTAPWSTRRPWPLRPRMTRVVDRAPTRHTQHPPPPTSRPSSASCPRPRRRRPGVGAGLGLCCGQSQQQPLSWEVGRQDRAGVGPTRLPRRSPPGRPGRPRKQQPARPPTRRPPSAWEGALLLLLLLPDLLNLTMMRPSWTMMRTRRWARPRAGPRLLTTRRALEQTPKSACAARTPSWPPRRRRAA